MRPPRFVIQKHAARRLHYDFRLEGEGVFKSWAVPKGPSLDPVDRRLAVAVEHHSLGWGDFEGVLAEGSYGAGAVLIWDAGTYQNLSQEGNRQISMAQALERGIVSFRLEGRKLRGGYTLRQMRGQDAANWLLIKQPDESARPGEDVRSLPSESVRSRRTIEEIAAEDAAP